MGENLCPDFSKLKEGDKVFVTNRWSGMTLSKVEKVTPTGRIKVNNSYFDKNGREIGGDRYGSSSLIEATEENIKKFKEQALIKKVINNLHKITEDSISYEDALEFAKILTSIDKRKEVEKEEQIER